VGLHQQSFVGSANSVANPHKTDLDDLTESEGQTGVQGEGQNDTQVDNQLNVMDGTQVDNQLDIQVNVQLDDQVNEQVDDQVDDQVEDMALPQTSRKDQYRVNILPSLKI
jgi:hypothetical protein